MHEKRIMEFRTCMSQWRDGSQHHSKDPNLWSRVRMRGSHSRRILKAWNSVYHAVASTSSMQILTHSLGDLETWVQG
ncbi:hypothetical protein VNO77_19231 [Canavalia gladiata]|uniref:Uncharacterized protein n=1 Tax=Canavalia gladiata TaxID=3824 RepID=A0AAN9QKB6_CANGL